MSSRETHTSRAARRPAGSLPDRFRHPNGFSVESYWPRVSPRERKTLRDVLYHDMVSEYDARLLMEYLQSLDIPLSSEFLCQARHWARDEERHYRGFLAVNERLFGRAEDELAGRRADFAPLAHLFADEFAICCLIAYDELATVRGYRVNLELYDRLGPDLGAFVRRVTAEEGAHYGGFLSVLRCRHAHRLREVPDAVARIRAAEGTPYANTFVLDHDEDLYTDKVLGTAARVLLRHIESSVRRREKPSCPLE